MSKTDYKPPPIQDYYPPKQPPQAYGGFPPQGPPPQGYYPPQQYPPQRMFPFPIHYVPRSAALARNQRISLGSLADCSIEGYYGPPQPVYIQQRAPRAAATDDLCCGMYVTQRLLRLFNF